MSGENLNDFLNKFLLVYSTQVHIAKMCNLHRFLQAWNYNLYIIYLYCPSFMDTVQGSQYPQYRDQHEPNKSREIDEYSNKMVQGTIKSSDQNEGNPESRSKVIPLPAGCAYKLVKSSQYIQNNNSQNAQCKWKKGSRQTQKVPKGPKYK
eukprot:TRINITY_DN1998_c0_g1_i1.p3 TRINITY_DN1998_c0_g1~~TRINITY_DN1998_c0_g1_i1.p3  ORF type:complete len:150 (-),score=1.72 TRINITY_DN1998_c0_g1_i1:362-811(-)